MTKKSAPIVFLNFEDTETDFNVVNNAEEAADVNYYKFVESEYDKLQMSKECEIEEEIDRTLIEMEPVVKKKRGRKPKPKPDGETKEKKTTAAEKKKPKVEVGDVESSSVSTMSDKPRKRGRKSNKEKEQMKSARKKKKKRDKKAYHFCDDDDDGDMGLEGEISDDEYIRRLQEQVRKEEILQLKEKNDSDDELESSSRDQESAEGLQNDNDGVSTLEDQFTVCDEDILSCKSDCSEGNETLVQNAFSNMNVYPDFDTEGNQNFPELELPPSSNDLRCPMEYLMDCCAVYEVLRRYGRLLRLSPFRFEDFIAAINARENSILLAEIHICLLKASLREDDASATWISLQDQKDSVNISFYLADVMCWPQLLRDYVNSVTPENDPSSALSHLEICNRYPYVDFRTRLRVLQTLTDHFLASSAVREEIIRENVIRYEDYCRICHKMGDLLCCDLCPAVFHLDCLDPPMSQVPRDEWHCPVCTQQQAMGVTDCVSQGERRGILHRHAPLGKDRHGRNYWFIARRLFVEAPSMDSDGCALSNGNSSLWYYSTVERFNQVLLALSKEYEEALIEALKENEAEIQRQMNLTKRLTHEKWQKHRENLNLTYPELLNEIAVSERNRLEAGGSNENNPVQPVSEDGLASGTQDTNSMVVDQETGEKLIGNENMHGGSGYVTRTRTGSIIQSYRNDGDYLVDKSGNIPTNEEELREMLKKQESENTKKPGVYEIDDRVYIFHADGARFQLRKNRTHHVDKNGGDRSLTGSFRLSDDGEWRKWINVYSSNQQEASSKQQFQEERDRRRFLSYKFSLTPSSEMEWVGDTHGSPSALLNALRLTICQLETRLPSALLTPLWKEERKNWYVGLHRCLTPRQLIIYLAKLEAAIKPVCFVNAWRDAVGHISLERITSVFREEKKKAKQMERKFAKQKLQEQSQTLNDDDDENGDEEETVVNETVYTKNPGQIKHRIWKMPGEEYRITAGDGWLWCSRGWRSRPTKANSRSLSNIAVKRRQMLLAKGGLDASGAPLGWSVLGNSECGTVVSHENRGSRFVLSGVDGKDIVSSLSQPDGPYYPNLCVEKAPSKLDDLLAVREAQEAVIKRDDNSVLGDAKENSEAKLPIEDSEKSELDFLKKKLEDLSSTKEQLEILLSQETAKQVKQMIAPQPRRGARPGVKRGPYKKRKQTIVQEPFTPSATDYSNQSRMTQYSTPSYYGDRRLPKQSTYYANDDSDQDMEMHDSVQKDEDYMPSSEEDGEDFLLPQVDGVVDDTVAKPEINVMHPHQLPVSHSSSSLQNQSSGGRPSMLMVKTATGQLVSVQMRSSAPANPSVSTTTNSSGLRILRLPSNVSNTQVVSSQAKSIASRPVATAVSGSLVVKKVAGRPSVGTVGDSEISSPAESAAASLMTPTPKQPISLPSSGVQTIKVVPGALSKLPPQLGNMRIVVRPNSLTSNNPGASLIKTSPPASSAQLSAVRSLSINTSSITSQSGSQKVPITTLTVDQIRALQQRRLQEHNVDLDSDDETLENRVIGGRQKIITSQQVASSQGQSKSKLSQQATISPSKPKTTSGTRPILPATASISSVQNTVIKQVAASGQSQQKPSPQYIRISVLPGGAANAGSGRQIVASAINSSGQPVFLQQVKTSSAMGRTPTISSPTTTGGRRSLAKQQHSSMTPIPIPAPTVVSRDSFQPRLQSAQRRRDDISGSTSVSLPGMTFIESLQVRIARLQVELNNTKNRIELLESNFIAKGRRSCDPVTLRQPKQMTIRKTLSSLFLPSSTLLPKITDFVSGYSMESKRRANGCRNLFRLDSDKLRYLIVKAGRVEMPGFHYEKKTSYLRWPYPGPRPSFCYGWRYRLQTADSLFGIALQLRIMWHCLKWDDIQAESDKFGICKEEKNDGSISYRRLLDVRYLDCYGLHCEVKVESYVFYQSKSASKVKARSLDSDDDPQENASDSDPDFRPGVSTGRRRRKRRPPKRSYQADDSGQQNPQEASVTVSWLPDSKVELWETRHYLETLLKLASASARTPSDNILMKSQLLPASTVTGTSATPTLRTPAVSLATNHFEPAFLHGRKFAFVNTESLKNRGQNEMDRLYHSGKEVAVKKDVNESVGNTSRPKRSNAGMKMRQWQDDSEVANMLAEYDEQAKPMASEDRLFSETPTRTSVLSRRPPPHLQPWNRQSEKALNRSRRSASEQRIIDEEIKQHRASVARQRAERQLHSRLRKQIFKRSKEWRLQMQEKRKLLYGELKLQIEEEVSMIKQQQMNALLERTEERRRKGKEKKLRKQGKLEVAGGVKKEPRDMDRSPETPKPKGRGRGRKPGSHASSEVLGSKVKQPRKRRASEVDSKDSPETKSLVRKKRMKSEPPESSFSDKETSFEVPPSKKQRKNSRKEKEVKKEPSSPSASKKTTPEAPKTEKRGRGRPKKIVETPTLPSSPAPVNPPDFQTPQKKRGRRKREESTSSVKEEFESNTDVKEELFCICKTPYDPGRFYIGCDLCEGWFHGECVNMSPKTARKVASWICPECQSQQDEMQEELYCLCRQPYDEKKFYVACDSCNDWFHGTCVGLSEEEALDIDSYICPRCINTHKNKRGRLKTLYDHRIKGALKTTLISLLEELKSNSMSWPFLEPIDTTEEPNYTRIVEHPMDLKTVESNLQHGKYKDIGHFVSDMHLIFSNCRRYNPKDTPHFRCADVLETLFVKRMKSVYSGSV